MKKRGRLIAFEGPDAHGKTTQSKLLHTSLDGVVGLDGNVASCAYVKVPVPGLTSRGIYWALGNGAAKRHPTAFQLAQFANKLLFQSHGLRSLLRQHDYVVLDRWALSGYVYGEATGTPQWLNDLLFKALVVPDVTVVVGGSRFQRGKADDSYERDEVLQARVKVAYDRIGLGWPKHFLVSNRGTTAEVHQRVVCVLQHAGVVPGWPLTACLGVR